MPVSTTSPSLPNEIKTLYERRLLTRALPRLVHGRLGQQAKWKGYGSYEVRRWESYSLVSTPLSEGTTPGENAAPTITVITITPVWYGAWVEYTDRLLLTVFSPALSEISGLLGEQAGLSVDTLVRNDLTDGATTDFAGGATARTNVDNTNDVISFQDVIQNIAQLETQNALPLQGMLYIGICHPHTWATLMQDSTFVTLFTREGGAALRNGRLGTILNLEIYVSSNARIYAAGGQGSIDVYDMLFIGKEAYVTAGLSGLFPNLSAEGGGTMVRGGMTGKKVNVVEIIVKDLGEGGVDPLNQRGTVGWKVTNANTVLNANWIRNLEHATDFS